MRLLFISDEHIGNNRNPSSRILRNIKRVISDLPDMDLLDAVINMGDSSDKLLSTRSQEYRDYLDLHIWLASLCDKFSIPYVYLVGTPVHEMDQFTNVGYILKEMYPNLDLRIYDDVGIDVINGYTFLYAADEAIHDNTAYEARVKELLENRGFDTVDFALTHTMYDCHISFPMQNLRSVDFINGIVKHNAFNGHIHTHSIYDKLVTIGSVDRLAYGEEEKKGIGLYEANHHFTEYRFIENRNALRFITLDQTLTLSKLKTILNKISGEVDIAYIGLTENAGISQFMLDEISQDYPNLVIELRNRKSTKKSAIVEIPTLDAPLEITPDNILDLIKEETSMHGIDEYVNKYISLSR